MEKSKEGNLGPMLMMLSSKIHSAKNEGLDDLSLMQKKVDARISKLSSNFTKMSNRVFELVDDCLQTSGLCGDMHLTNGPSARRYSIESLSSAETGNVHDINGPDLSSNSNSIPSRPTFNTSSPVSILRKTSVPIVGDNSDVKDFLIGSPKKKKQSFSGESAYLYTMFKRWWYAILPFAESHVMIR